MSIIHDGKKTVIDGPFAETKELIAGFWIWQVKSLDEAVEWVRGCPENTYRETPAAIAKHQETGLCAILWLI